MADSSGPTASDLAELETLRDQVMEEATPILEDISLHTRIARKAVGQDPVDMLTLSNEIIELAILNARLGERIATLGYVHRSAKEYYERTREGAKVQLVKEGNAAGVADSMKVEVAHDAYVIYNDIEYSFERINFARRATDKTIDTIRTKISYEKSAERNA